MIKPVACFVFAYNDSPDDNSHQRLSPMSSECPINVTAGSDVAAAYSTISPVVFSINPYATAETGVYAELLISRFLVVKIHPQTIKTILKPVIIVTQIYLNHRINLAQTLDHPIK